MTQSMDYTATLKTKRCKNTGMTEDIIRQLHGRPGARVMAIVELKVDDAHHKDDAPNHIDFTVEQVQPFVDDDQAEFLRKLCRSAHQKQVLNSSDGQLTIDGQEDLEPSVDDLIAEQRAGTDPYAYVHAKGGRGEPGADTPCGLRATGDKTLTTHVDVDQITCRECLAILAEEDADAVAKEPVPAGT